MPSLNISADSPPILTHKRDGVTTLTMNTPARLNGWTMEMMNALKDAFRVTALDEGTRVLILTGADPYYCAGVNLAATLRLGHPPTFVLQWLSGEPSADFCPSVAQR